MHLYGGEGDVDMDTEGDDEIDCEAIGLMLGKEDTELVALGLEGGLMEEEIDGEGVCDGIGHLHLNPFRYTVLHTLAPLMSDFK